MTLAEIEGAWAALTPEAQASIGHAAIAWRLSAAAPAANADPAASWPERLEADLAALLRPAERLIAAIEAALPDTARLRPAAPPSSPEAAPWPA